MRLTTTFLLTSRACTDSRFKLFGLGRYAADQTTAEFAIFTTDTMFLLVGKSLVRVLVRHYCSQHTTLQSEAVADVARLEAVPFVLANMSGEHGHVIISTAHMLHNLFSLIQLLHTGLITFSLYFFLLLGRCDDSRLGSVLLAY